MMKQEPMNTALKARRKSPSEETARKGSSSKDLFKILANKLQTGVYIIQNKKLRFFNLHLQESTGYLEAEMLSLDPISLIHPSDRPKTVKNATDMLNGMRLSPYEYRLLTKQGKVRWIMETVTPIILKGERAFFGNCMDITEEKKARENLQELDALKSSILDAIPQAVVGLHHRCINFANAAVEEVFGWRPEELIGKSVTTFYRNEKEAEEIARCFYTMLEHQRTFVTEFPCRRKDGQEILCRIRSSRIGEKLKARRIVITYEDITEQQRSKEELANSREQLRNLSIHLQSVREDESTRVAREIHDELGQSLTALQMDFSWLGDHMPEKHTQLREKVQRMGRLVDTTIDSVHRISKELRPTLLDDLGLMAAMEWQLQEFQERSGVRCEARLDCKDNLVKKDIATAVFRIFQETLTNVLRHASAKRVRVRLAETGDNNLCLEVADNGKGITPQQINDSRSFGIIGIRERVNLWGGSVSITGDAGKGTKVAILIPIHKGDN